MIPPWSILSIARGILDSNSTGSLISTCTTSMSISKSLAVLTA